ncbi:MAG: hypothetical protein GY928_19600 [Colwellia sp.]|nr:hypothetical protein [Colwellia sp.]
MKLSIRVKSLIHVIFAERNSVIHPGMNLLCLLATPSSPFQKNTSNRLRAHEKRHRPNSKPKDDEINFTSEEESEEDDEIEFWDSDSSEVRWGENKPWNGSYNMLCEFSALGEGVKVDFELLKGGSRREGVIEERENIPGKSRKLRIVEEGEKGKGKWYNYEKDFKSLDAVTS